MKKHLLTVAMSLFVGAAAAANVTGDVRGVTFFYLDGGVQDFPWVLDNLDNAQVREKINNLLASYQQKGVNWIRLLVGRDHMPTSKSDAYWIARMNQFLQLTYPGRFTVEVVLLPRANNGNFSTDRTYDKQWLGSWISGMNYTNVGMVLINGDTSPCGFIDGSNVRCEGEPGVLPLNKNHGEWIKDVWGHVKSNYPNLNVGYEVIGVDSNNSSPELIRKTALWANANTPSAAFLAASLYFKLPSGSNWQAYGSKTLEIINAYKSVSQKPLWIDEYGFAVDVRNSYPGNDSFPHTYKDQKAYYDGFLAATTCFSQDKWAKFAWVAGNDAPYNNQFKLGLVTGFNNGVPQWTSAGDTMGLYYNLAACP